MQLTPGMRKLLPSLLSLCCRERGEQAELSGEAGLLPVMGA